MVVALRPQAIPSNGAWHRPCLDPNDYGKNILVPNEWLDFEKSCVEHQCGPGSALTYLKAKAPCSGITLERKALRVMLEIRGEAPFQVLSPRQGRKFSEISQERSLFQEFHENLKFLES